MCLVFFMRFLCSRKFINIRRLGVFFFSDYVENLVKMMYIEMELK